MFESVVLGVVGLFLGRFLNLTISRLPPRPSFDPASATDHYRNAFVALAMVPLVSHFWGMGRSGYDFRLAIRSIAVESITVLLCGFVGYQYGLTLASAVLVFYCALFIHLAFVDLEHSLILNKVVLPALPVALALFPFSPLGQSWDIGDAYLRALGGAGLGFAMLLVVYVASRGGTGAGDVKLAALLGATLGFPQIAAGLPIGFVIGGLIGLVVLVFRLKGRNDTIPFGPALIIGAAAVLLIGPDVYNWYLDLFR